MADLKLSLIITADGKAAVTGIQQVQQAAEGVGTSAHAGATQAGAAFDGLGSKVGALGRNLGALLGIGFGAAMVKEAVMVGDAYNVLQSRIQDATRATGNYAATSQAVFEISQKTGTVLSTSVSLYQSLARSAGELGAKQADVLKLTETVQKLGVVGGSSTQNLNAGLLQFGQMLAGGVAHAEEMNSLLENIPAVAEAIARGMGMTTGQLRAAVLEGKVLSKDVFAAIQSQSGDVDQRFRGLPLSISRATTELDNAWALFMGNLLKSTGAAEALAAIIESTAKKLTEWGKALDPAKQALNEAETLVIRISERLRASEGQGALYRWMHGSNDQLRNELDDAINNLIALQDQASAFGSKGAAAFNNVSTSAQQTSVAVSDVMRSVMDLNAELRIQLAMGDQSRAHMQAYRNEAKLQAEIDKAMAEGKADVAFALEEERAGVMAVNAENIKLQGTLDAQKEAHKAATVHTRAHSAAKRELAKETRDYARESERAVEFVERENAAIMETSERLLKLAAEYGNSEAKTILYERQLDEVTRALEAMGATADEVRAAQQRLWEDMTAEGQAAVKIREANEKAAKEAAEAWQKSADEIERSLTDALMRGFEGGKGFAENLVDTLKNMFNTLVLRPIIQAIVQPVAGAVAGMMPGVSSASAAGGYGDLINTASNLYSVGSSLWTGIGNAATSVMTGAVASGFMTGMDIAIANIGAAGYFGAFTTTMSTAISSAASGAVGTAVGAAIPYIGWIVAAVALIAKFMGSNKDTSPDLTLIQGAHRMDQTRGTYFEDTGSDRNNQAGFISDAFGGFFFGTQHADLTAEAKQQLQAMFTAYGQAFDTIAGLISQEMIDSATQALENLKKQNPERPSAWDDGMAQFFHDRFDILFSTIGGDLEALYTQLLGDVDFGNAADVTQLANSIAVISTATGDFKAILDSLLNPTLTSAQAISDLSAENEIWAATLVRLGAEVVGVNGILEALGVTVLSLDITGAQAADSLIALAGGMDNLAKASTYFFENFYTQEEQRARIAETTGQVIAAFNEQWKDTIAASGAVTDGIIDTKEELRAFVESLDLTTEAGQQAFLAAMALAPTLVANADALAALGQAAGDATDQIIDAVGDINERLKGNGDNRFNDPNRFGGHNAAPAPGQTGGEAQAGPGVPDIGGWQPWHDVGPAAGSGGGTGGGTTAGQTLEEFLAGVQNAIDQMTLSEYELALKAIAADMTRLRAEAEALGFGPEAQAAIDQLEALRLAHLADAEAAAQAAEAERVAAAEAERAGKLADLMAGVADGLDQLNLSDAEYQLKRLAAEFDAMRAQAEALGASAEQLALIDQLQVLKQAEIEAAAAAEAQAEAQHQADAQASALEDSYKGVLAQLDDLIAATDRYNQAIAETQASINDSILSIQRQQKGWDEVAYQTRQIAALKQRLDQTTGLEQIAVAKQLQAAIVAKYNAEKAAIEAQTTELQGQTQAIQEQRDQLASLQQEEVQRYEQLHNLAKGLRQYLDSLKLSNLSPLTNAQRLEEAKRQYQDTLQRAQMGDQEAAAQLQGAAQAYLGEARNYYASSPAYTAIFDSVTDSLATLADAMEQAMGPSTAEYQAQDLALSAQQAEIDAQIADLQSDAIDELQSLQELLNQLEIENALAAQEQADELKASLDEIGGQVESMKTQISNTLYAGFTGLVSQGQQSLAKFDALIAAINAMEAAAIYAAQAGANTGAMA